MFDPATPLTGTDVAMVAGGIVSLVMVWFRFEARLGMIAGPAKQLAIDAMAKADANAELLASYRLEVAENYAKHTFIRDVEERLGSRFDAMTSELHGLRQDFHDAMIAVASAARRQTTVTRTRNSK